MCKQCKFKTQLNRLDRINKNKNKKTNKRIELIQALINRSELILQITPALQRTVANFKTLILCCEKMLPILFPHSYIK